MTGPFLGATGPVGAGVVDSLAAVFFGAVLVLGLVVALRVVGSFLARFGAGDSLPDDESWGSSVAFRLLDAAVVFLVAAAGASLGVLPRDLGAAAVVAFLVAAFLVVVLAVVPLTADSLVAVASVVDGLVAFDFVALVVVVMVSFLGAGFLAKSRCVSISNNFVRMCAKVRAKAESVDTQ